MTESTRVWHNPPVGTIGCLGISMSMNKGLAEFITYCLWVGLWMVTLDYAGLTLWAMLSTASLPQDYQIPPGWIASMPSGPDAQAYWLYFGVLATNILWETWFKASKTYVPSSFPFPDMRYGTIALFLWVTLWILGQNGAANGWFKYPSHLGSNVWACFWLFLAQKIYIRYRQNQDKFKEDGEESPTEAEAVPPPTPAPDPKVDGVRPKPAKSALVTSAVTSGASASGDSEFVRKVLEHIRLNGHAKTGVLVEASGHPRRTVIRILNKMLADGRIVREGNGSGAVYKLKSGMK